MNTKTDLTLHKSSLQGLRDSNEDKEGYFFNLGKNGLPVNIKYSPIDIFIVADGHGGDQVSSYIVPKLIKYLSNKKLKYPLDEKKINKIYNGIQKKIIKKEIGQEEGSTCVVVIRYYSKALIKRAPASDDYNKEHRMQVFNLGDSRAIMAKDNKAIELTKDHKPNSNEEKKRIELVNTDLDDENKKGVYLDDDHVTWRIDDLSVSRSFGDLYATPHVTHIPEIFDYSLKNISFIVLACDGLYDVFENDDVVNFINEHRDSKKNIARLLAEEAIRLGSGDNVSVMIIFI